MSGLVLSVPLLSLPQLVVDQAVDYDGVEVGLFAVCGADVVFILARIAFDDAYAFAGIGSGFIARDYAKRQRQRYYGYKKYFK